MPTRNPLPALAALLCLTGLAGCSSSGFVDSLALAPVQAAPLAMADIAEPGAVEAQLDTVEAGEPADPTVEVASAGAVTEPFTQMAYAAPASPIAPSVLKPSTPRGSLDVLIARYSAEYGVPEQLVHRVVNRESTYNPQAQHGGHYGLMQIKPETARIMGFRGSASDLYDAETNLKYGVKYLRGAWLLANGSQDRAVQLYSAGYYYEAKRRGMLVETGLRSL